MGFYKRCSDAELVTFALNRGIQVPTEKQNYIKALKRADASRTFNFLDLPPELRNMVYRELLVLRGTNACHPQILCTCSLIDSEASTILYGDNVIQIDIHHYGVAIRGKICGAYETDYVYKWADEKQQNQGIKWPDFIRRAQSLRLSVTSFQLRRNRMRRTPRIGALYYILYSLCDFLHRGHRLRSLLLDLNGLCSLFAVHGALQEFDNGIAAALCPLRLLSSIKHLQVHGISHELELLVMPSIGTMDEADSMIAGFAPPLMKNINLAVWTSMLMGSGGTLPRVHQSLSWVFSGLLLIFEGSTIRSGLIHDFCKVMEILRKNWDRRPAEFVTEQCRKQIEFLVRLEVEMKVALNREDRGAERDSEMRVTKGI